jgi:peptide/nickel transport system ATP-binding protein
MGALLELKGVSKTYASGVFNKRSVMALHKTSFLIGGERPRITAVVGESGSGKTTMGLLFLGFIRPTSGQILFEGKDLWKLPRSAWKQYRQQVQAIFQDPFEVYNPFYKVDHMLEVPIQKFMVGTTGAQRRAMIESALETVGLRPDETLGRYPHQLSGGQRQRIMVARALVLRPRVIIADEPVSMVDASLRATMLKSLQGLRNDHGISIVYITHDLATAYHISDDILIMYQGRIVEAGNANSVITNPQHPYTQLLVSSIPWPDPERKWGAAETTPNNDQKAVWLGCPFAPRCSRVMDVCNQERPELYRTSPDRAVECFQYRDNPVLEKGLINSVLVDQ